mgnify:CR=1 FL=1
MSFFGITAFGPQNPFETKLVSAIGLKFFTEEEFKQAFERIDKDSSGYIEVGEVWNLLKETYGMDPLEEEVEMFMQEFDTNQDGRISWEEFCGALRRLISSLEEKSKKASEVKSFEDWNFMRRKHIRPQGHPHEKFRSPVTSSQVHGFFDDTKVRKDPTATKTNFNRTRCDETKYADTLISGGHFFS